jgi:hypothetical protein
VFLRGQKPLFRPDKIVLLLARGRGEVFGETIAQPDFAGHFKTSVGDLAAAWVRAEGSCKLRVVPRALNSAVECHLHTVEVAGSNPAAPTIESTTYRHRGGKSLLQVAPAIS